MESLPITCALIVCFYQNLQWAHRKKEVTDLYSDYVIDLLSAHTFYLKPVLYMLVKNLMMPGKDDRQLDSALKERLRISAMYKNMYSQL